MSQYFENDKNLKDEPIQIHFTIQNKEYQLQSNTGVFSKDKLDTGTKILLESVLKEEKNPSRCLDLGCGIGPVGVVLASNWNSEIMMIDINERAVSLASQNIKNNHCKATIKCQDGICTEDGMFDCIVLNPPIRTGKKVIYSLFDQCIEHLKGNLYIVIRKQHGAQSAMNYLEEKGCVVERIVRDKGYWVLKCYCK
ncbi:class I SAM-dependent methyltransferase [Floccifex sp.]|uniref:class I SAM-dependent methyltransferase n=1 Tax=Floccifex sp. TaxID=2815810 RepID=UPI002A757DAB|nr:methyltransferase [Floccifex sp.]MDD7282185.1 methyltransferase [Erysipelotrichaceae bacterium]MDY2959078.1 methyltransferase [Floccifex sp.]